MSSFKGSARHKQTGELHEVWCMDDYFGKHVYGYIPNIEGGEPLHEAEFEKQYDWQES